MTEKWLTATEAERAAYDAKSDAEKNADSAVWAWALASGGVPAVYNEGYDDRRTATVREHLAVCEFDRVRSKTPTFTEVQAWVSTMQGTETVDAIVGRLKCRCGEIDTEWEVGDNLTEPMTLSQIIMTVNQTTGH